MPYQIEWEVPQSVLSLRLLDHVTLQEFVEIDRGITDRLDTVSDDARIALMVDTIAAKSVPQAYNDLKASQTYAVRRNAQLEYILVVSGSNKLMRLMMMLTYNLCRPRLQFFDTPAQALFFLSRTGRVLS